ncbi:MAG: hypothetical protein EXR47_06470 [Dehalococcoidia bacterium]|nr:hypothetical protein [Dehalococcoidia bacterium]
MLAKFLDYGASLWRMSYVEFEQQAIRSYFSGPRRNKQVTKAVNSLSEASQAVWGKGFDTLSFRDSPEDQLKSGDFRYVVVAQSFPTNLKDALDYLNKISSGPRFYSLKLTRFGGNSISAFACNLVAGPEPPPLPPRERIPLDKFLANVPRGLVPTFSEILDACGKLGLTIFWGTRGCIPKGANA